MLVKGWTVIGHIRSSYENTMGFRASTRVAEETTQTRVTFPLFCLIKSNTYLSKFILPLEFKLSSLSEYLMSCLERGTSEIRHLPIFLKIRRSLIRGFQPLRDDRLCYVERRVEWLVV